MCAYAIAPGTTMCATHTAQQPGTKPGRKPSIPEAQVGQALRQYEAGGQTWAKIAEQAENRLSPPSAFP